MRTLLLSGLVALATAGPINAQPYFPGYPGDRFDPRNGRFDRDEAGRLVRYWYTAYLRRPADPGEVRQWANLLRRGVDPAEVLSRILASREYYEYAGGTRAGYITQLILDVGHHHPTGDEISFYLRRSRFTSPQELAYSFLMEYPQNWIPGGPGRVPPRHEWPWE